LLEGKKRILCSVDRPQNGVERLGRKAHIKKNNGVSMTTIRITKPITNPTWPQGKVVAEGTWAWDQHDRIYKPNREVFGSTKGNIGSKSLLNWEAFCLGRNFRYVGGGGSLGPHKTYLIPPPKAYLEPKPAFGGLAGLGG